MVKIVECIPNFSEGRNQAVIDAVAAAVRGVAGVALLDCAPDPSHNRTVLTMMGGPDDVAEAAVRLCKTAAELIDMTAHTGEHPRMGATDVIPFVPIRNMDMGECIALSKIVAQRVWGELQIPVFLYAESASCEGRANLADVRRGQFEGMPAKLLKKDWAPDYGERRIHPTAGVVAIGARAPLVAYNVNLNTSDISIAKTIADKVRGSKGGFKECKAMGVMLEGRNIAQVSMNLTDYTRTPIYVVHDAIRAEAERLGVNIVGSELIGLAPAKALIDCAEHYLQIEHFDYDTQVLENHIS